MDLIHTFESGTLNLPLLCSNIIQEIKGLLVVLMFMYYDEFNLRCNLILGKYGVKFFYFNTQHLSLKVIYELEMNFCFY